MRTLKKAVCILSVVLILLSFTVFSALAFFGMIMASDDSVPKDEIIEFVNEHKDELEECAENYDFSEFEGRGIVKSVYESGTYTEFSCGGRGLAGGSSYYCGFFYSPYDSRSAKWNGLPMHSYGDGFLYAEEFGDNKFYCEKIFDCFYYYEESY